MNFYSICPTDLSSPSHHWLVDEVGLEVVKNHYSNYPKDPDNPIDRWPEFKVEKISFFDIDFGGMYHTLEPHFSQKIYGIDFEGCVTHIPIFVEALDVKYHHKRWDVWRFKMWRTVVVFSKKTRNHIKKVFKSKEKEYKKIMNNYLGSLNPEKNKILKKWKNFVDENNKK